MRNAMKKRRKIKRTPVPQRKPADYWSDYQNKIFKHVSDGEGHAVVLASPGAGKSTTIVESLHHVPKNEENLCLAFNTSVADELTLKVPLGTRARTFHRLGLETVKANWGEVYGLKGREFIDKDDEAAMALATKAVSGINREAIRVRENLIWAMKMSKTMLADTPAQIEGVCREFGIAAGAIGNKEFVNVVHKMLEKMKVEPLTLNGHRVISFDDMLWLPHVHGWNPTQFNRVFVDEAQDLSASRVNLVLKALKPGGRLCAVGDRNQAIYGFAGATPGVIDTVIDDMSATCLPLSVSYRCPRRVVELAADINPDIKAAESAIDGNINTISEDDLHKKLVPGKSAVLSRNNFALITCAFSLLKRGVRATILGKDIGNRFIWRINNWMPDTVQELRADIYEWRAEACEGNSKANQARITDEAESILRFTREAETVDEVKSLIRKFFTESSDDQVKLSTAHKAKGLEWEHVFMLEKTFKPGKNQEEDNICYVAITRAQKSLTFVR